MGGMKSQWEVNVEAEREKEGDKFRPPANLSQSVLRKLCAYKYKNETEL